jgi:hypothetical protein
MLHVILITIFSFFFANCQVQEDLQTPPVVLDAFFPPLAYVQLSKALVMHIGDTETPLGSWSAGGVCVELDDGGCFVLTANHFCHSDLEELFGPEPKNFDYNSNFKIYFAGETISGSTGTGWVVAQEPATDLCLIWVEGDFEHAVNAIANEENVENFAALSNWGAPRGFFRPYPSFGLLLFEGYWGGWCEGFCRLPGIVEDENVFMHSIPTSSGQSGSAIFLGEKLFGMQIASNSSIDSFGISTRPSAIHNFLLANNINKPYL